MPITFFDEPQGTGVTPSRSGIVFREGASTPPQTVQDDVAPESDEGSLVTPMALAGAAGLIGAGVIAHNPKMAATGAGKVLKAIQTYRLTSMLSGLAPLKSMLGNVGAAGNISMEMKTLAPLKSLFSRQTLTDAVSEFRNPTPHSSLGPTGVGSMSKWNIPGRIMQAGDQATQNALVRSGTVTREEAQRQLLQSPLPARMAKAFDSPVGDALLPFRRTPFNQFIEGFDTMKSAAKGENLLPMAVHTAGGFASGAATSDDQYPIGPAAYASLAGRYGVPAALAALVGRGVAGGKGAGGIVEGVLPVAEYGITQSVENPAAPLSPDNWALSKLIKRTTGQ